MPKFAFFGTDEFAVLILDALKEAGLMPALVVTAPDKPKGRKLVLTPPPAKAWADAAGVPAIQPPSLKQPVPELENETWDFFLVASYGKIIPGRILDLPRRKTLNVHPSLLPKHRGASPLQAAILSGEAETGVTIMQLDEEMDHGPLLAAETVPLETQTYEELRDDLAGRGARLLIRILPSWLEGSLEAVEQDHARATYTAKISKEDGLLDLAGDPAVNWRKIRAYTPWPGAYFFLNGKRIIVKKARLENGGLVIERIIPEGKKEMAWADYARNA